MFRRKARAARHWRGKVLPMVPADPPDQPPRFADHYDAELRWHHERLLLATGIGPADHVLDIGCGAGQSTRDAARAAVYGSALGVDVSEQMLERARRRTADEGPHNVAYELGDAQVHPFAPAHFDLIISRFGTMFFADPVAAFRNIARAAKPGARLVMIVWQTEVSNEWATAIRDSLTGGAVAAPVPPGLDPFSLADPRTVEAILTAASFAEIDFEDVHVPVYYGPDPATAFDLVCDLKMTKDLIAGFDGPATERALSRLRDTLSAHHTADGVLFDSRSRIVTARRAP
jgi:SAM-dependent methyltransferase